MVIHYYAIFDRKAKSFGEPLAFGSPEKDAVTRWFDLFDLSITSDSEHRKTGGQDEGYPLSVEQE